MSLRDRIYQRRHSERYRVYGELMAHLAMDRGAVEDLQAKLLTNLLGHAVATVPRYEDLAAPFRQTVRDGGGGKDLLALFPVVTKSDIRARPDLFTSRRIGGIPHMQASTGGSTGDPLHFLRDMAYQHVGDASLLRSFSLMGWQPGTRQLWLWGHDLHSGRLRSLRRAVNSWFSGRYVFNAFDMTDRALASLPEIVARKKPAYVYGYASTTAFVADYLTSAGITLEGIRGVMTTAEKLDGSQRERIGDAFGAPVYDQYGSREVAGIATECSRGALHVFTDLVHVETPGAVEGERFAPVIVTGLYNRSMPLIRYDLGDEGRLLGADCPCGLPFPLMEIGAGKSSDYFVFPSGTRVSGAYFRSLMFGVEGVQRFQFVQHRKDLVELNVVRDSRFDSAAAGRIRDAAARIRRDFGADVEVRVSWVDAIPLTPAGKFRYIVSRIG